jgi:hypothetical protein
MDYAKPDLTLQLPKDVYHQVIHTLRAAIPPVTDAPEDLVTATTPRSPMACHRA